MSIASIVGYVYSNSRVQFHPAAYALMYGVLWVALMTAALFGISLVRQAFGSSGLVLGYDTLAAVFGPVILGELVRGNARAWLGYDATAWCFPAIAIAGFAAGAVFGVLMVMKWGRSPWLEVPVWGAACGAFYLLVGWTMRLEEKKRLAASG